MNGWIRHPLRVTARLLWFSGELLFAASRLLTTSGFRGNPSAAHKRAVWLHQTCRRLRRVIGLETQVAGHLPSRGLLVSNHLSYVDIVLLAALTPAVFVAKREVKGWPVFGWFARRAGTIFVHRERRAKTGEVTDEIEAALRSGLLVVLFPEGTSSDGQTVLPFKSALLEPAARNAHALTAGRIRYELHDGDPGEEVCYWNDMVLVPHLINLFGKRHVRGFLRVEPVAPTDSDRKALARTLHAKILSMGPAEGRELRH